MSELWALMVVSRSAMTCCCRCSCSSRSAKAVCSSQLVTPSASACASRLWQRCFKPLMSLINRLASSSSSESYTQQCTADTAPYPGCFGFARAFGAFAHCMVLVYIHNEEAACKVDSVLLMHIREICIQKEIRYSCQRQAGVPLISIWVKKHA